MKYADLAFGGATLVTGVAYYFMATSVPMSQLADAIGPQGLPKVYALMLVALSLILIVTSLRDVRFAIRSPRASGNRSRSFLRAAGMVFNSPVVDLGTDLCVYGRDPFGNTIELIETKAGPAAG